MGEDWQQKLGGSQWAVTVGWLVVIEEKVKSTGACKGEQAMMLGPEKKKSSKIRILESEVP